MNRIRGHVPYRPKPTSTEPRKPPVVSAEFLHTFSRWRVPEEDNRLKYLWGHFSIQEIADMMGRSRRLISEKAEKLNLRRVASPCQTLFSEATQKT